MAMAGRKPKADEEGKVLVRVRLDEDLRNDLAGIANMAGKSLRDTIGQLLESHPTVKAVRSTLSELVGG